MSRTSLSLSPLSYYSYYSVLSLFPMFPFSFFLGPASSKAEVDWTGLGLELELELELELGPSLPREVQYRTD